MTTYAVYLDEFGHDGPFLSRSHIKYNTSPVFGLGGFLIPIENARSLSAFYFNLKKQVFERELSFVENKAHWRKKGGDFLTPNNMKSKETRRVFKRIIKKIILENGGRTIFVGTEKIRTESFDGPGLYLNTIREVIKRMEYFCNKGDDNFVMFLDRHSGRKKHVAACGMEMFGENKRKRILEPLFHVEGNFYQTIQISDWICSALGKIHAYNTCPMEYADYKIYKDYFDLDITENSARSNVRSRPVENTIMRDALIRGLTG